MNVLAVLDSTDPRSGGPLQGLRSRAEAMAAHGVQFTAVTTDDPGAIWLPDLPFTVHGCGPVASQYGFAPSMQSCIQRLLPQSEAVVVHGLWQYHGVACRRACRAEGRRYAVFTHGMLDPWFRRRYPGKHLKKQLYWWLQQRAILRDAHAVLFTSEAERDLAEGAFWPYRGLRTRVVQYGIRDPGPPTTVQDAAWQEQVPGLGDRPYVLFLGRLHEKKCPEELVEAYLDLPAPGFDLVVAGPGENALLHRLRRRLLSHPRGQHVHVPGLVQGDAKWGAFHAAEAFILPSHQENFGIAVAEALAAGTPVLISDRVNIWREIIDAGAGYAAPDTPAGIRDLLDRWQRTTPPERKAMESAARVCFLRHFEVDQSSVAYHQLLQELAP